MTKSGVFHLAVDSRCAAKIEKLCGVQMVGTEIEGGISYYDDDFRSAPYYDFDITINFPESVPQEKRHKCEQAIYGLLQDALPELMELAEHDGEASLCSIIAM